MKEYDAIQALWDKCKRTEPQLFAVGQTVRVNKTKENDGQTPRWWYGSKCRVVSTGTSPLYGQRWYCLRHPNGKVDDWKQEEIDRRYRLKNQKKSDA